MSKHTQGHESLVVIHSFGSRTPRCLPERIFICIVNDENNEWPCVV